MQWCDILEVSLTKWKNKNQQEDNITLEGNCTASQVLAFFKFTAAALKF
jgi:hypothetical protein